MLKLCILDAKTLGSDMDLSVFEKFGDVSIYQVTSPLEVIDRIKDCDIIIANKVLLNESNLKYAPNVKIICLTATGTNNVDLLYTKNRGIAVTNVAGYSTPSVVQHTFAMLFYLLEQLRYYDEYVKSGDYIKNDIFTHLDRPFMELSGKTWGIIGLGTIGRDVASIAKAFGCNVVYFSTSGKNNNPEYKSLELDELLKTAHIVSIHAPLNPQTLNLIDFSKLSLMKKDAIILNLGRGGIINEKDLAEAIEKDIIGGAALDVLEREPMLSDSPLKDVLKSPKLFVTPHIAWASIEARTRLVNEIVLNIEAFINGEERNRVC